MKVQGLTTPWHFIKLGNVYWQLARHDGSLLLQNPARELQVYILQWPSSSQESSTFNVRGPAQWDNRVFQEFALHGTGCISLRMPGRSHSSQW